MNSNLPKVGAEAVLETSSYERDIKKAIALADKFDKSINDLSGSVDMKVNVNDSDLKTAKGLADDLDSTVSTKVNADDSDLDDVKEKLDDIAEIGAIDLAINVAGQAKEFFDSLGRFSGVGGVLELDDALAMVEARTGRMIPDAEKLISDLYTNGWGESRTQIAEVVAQAGQLGVAQADMSEALTTAFEVAAVTGEDVNQVLSVMDTMVKTGISPDFQAAGDVITVGFQNGLNKSDDLLDSLNEYATKLASLGISAEGSLAILNSGLEQGVMNTDFISDSIREFGIRLGDMGTDPNIQAAFDELDSLTDIDLEGLLDAYESGKISGDQFLQGMFDAIGEANTKDPQAANNAVEQLFGTQAEDLGAEIWGNLSTDADVAFGDIEGRASEAGTTISDTLGTTIETFLRTIEQAAVDFLESDAVNLDQKIEDLKTGLQNALGVLSGGGSIGEALEAGLGITGVDTALQNIERVFGNLVIELLGIVASVQEFTGHGEQAQGTRAMQARLAEGQFSFDIKVSNPDEIDAIVSQAIGRGVDESKLGELAGKSVEEFIASGEIEKAQALLDSLNSAASTVVASGLAPGEQMAAQVILDSGDIELINAAVNEGLLIKPNIDTADLQTKIDAAVEAAKPDPGEGWWNNLKPPTDALENSKQFSLGTDTASRGDGWWQNFAGTDAQTAIDETTTKVDTLRTTTTDTLTAMENAAGLSSQGIVDAIAAMGTAATEADAEIVTAMTGNTITTSFDDVLASADANFPGVIAWFDRTAGEAAAFDSTVGIHLRSVTKQLNDLNFLALTTIANITGAQALGGSGAVTNNTTNNVNVTNNNSNGAQTTNSQYQLAQMLGG